MNSLIHREDDDVEDFSERPDREITLGTTTILALFFALAVLCAVFFGFGYSVGHRAVGPVATVAPGQSGSSFAGFKPSASDPLAASGAAKTGNLTVTIPVARPDEDAPVPLPRPVQSTQAQDEPQNASAEPTPVTPTPQPAPVQPSPSLAPAVAAPMPLASGNGPIVQIAAVSHQEDADLLVTTLKRRGYTVVVRSEPQDKFLHVQVGPFATHKDADAMRQRLLNDGFNAIVKDPGTH